MELVRNKASGKIFVVLEDANDTEFIAITPDGKVKKLEKRFFSGMDVLKGEFSPANWKATDAQVDMYCNYYGG